MFGYNHHRYSPLHIAVRNQSLNDVIKELSTFTGHRYIIDTNNYLNATAVHLAINNDKYTKLSILNLLLKNSNGIKSLTEGDVHDSTPLHHAVENRDHRVAKILLRYKEGRDSMLRIDIFDHVPIYYAFFNDDLPMVKILMSYDECLESLCYLFQHRYHNRYIDRYHNCSHVPLLKIGDLSNIQRDVSTMSDVDYLFDHLDTSDDAYTVLNCLYQSYVKADVEKCNHLSMYYTFLSDDILLINELIGCKKCYDNMYDMFKYRYHNRYYDKNNNIYYEPVADTENRDIYIMSDIDYLFEKLDDTSISYTILREMYQLYINDN